jgi:hypothetical protein
LEERLKSKEFELQWKLFNVITEIFIHNNVFADNGMADNVNADNVIANNDVADNVIADNV